MKNKLIESILVGVQVITAGYLVIMASWTSMPAILMAIVIASGFLAIWSIGIMKIDNLRIVPTPLDSARLRVHGPYRLIRHPMYSSLILLSIPLVIQHPEPVRITMGVLLSIDLLLKLHYEEKLLVAKFPEYTSYMRTTKRLIPYLY